MSDAYDKRKWRGYTFDNRTIAAIKELEKRLGKPVRIFQGSYSTSVGASAGTHSGGGAVDWWVDGISATRATRVARQVGFADWWRKPTQGDWPNHQHGILLGHKTASPEAKLQDADYRNEGNGLYPYVGGDDTQPYRPDPIVEFDYATWKKERRLRDRLREVTNAARALLHKRRQILRELERLS